MFVFLEEHFEQLITMSGIIHSAGFSNGMHAQLGTSNIDGFDSS